MSKDQIARHGRHPPDAGYRSPSEDHVTAGGRGVVGHAGARLLADLADATGLTAQFGQALAGLRQRDSGHDPGRVAVDMAVMIADGGEAIADLAVLRGQFEALLPMLWVG